MYREDNSGFINFPSPSKEISRIDSGKTLVYIVSFEIDYEKDNMSSINLFQPGIFVSDDMVSRPEASSYNDDIDQIVKRNKEQDFYDEIYFPNKNLGDWKGNMSIDLISCICIGWSNYTYEYNDKIKFWNAGFGNLTNEGKKLYYSMRKLHNNKEVRILTFNNI